MGRIRHKTAGTHQNRSSIMLFDYILGGVVTVGILAYLIVALVRPEKF